ncbi:MAG: ribbon-helix-helix domain-containing protein [Synergistota bacterium]|jgi:metal-responsive CopG/Arc/MetJ family transcriptional regulator|nr:ribbon-helix-helix domain-containing protein [Synergistota bacterium]
MGVVKIGITVDSKILKRLDELVQSKVFPSRSRAIHEALSEKLMRLEKRRLASECAKLDPDFERSLAEESLPAELEEWPEY